MRKPQMGFHSFERIFEGIRGELPDNIEVKEVYSWFHSRGLFRRLLNLVQVLFLRADVYHITGDIHYLALGLIGRRVVLTVHDLAPLHRKHGLSRYIFRLLWYIWPMRIASVTTAVSEFTKAELVQHTGVDLKNVLVTPNFVTSGFSPFAKSWPVDPDLPVILMVGTKPNKNLGRMFRALQGMKVKVHLIGKLGDEQRRSLEECEVAFKELGLLDESGLIEAYRDCDVVAFASTYEGFGMPILEAQAVGRPLLTSNYPPMSDVAGEGAVLVDPLDIDSIKSGFASVLNYEDYRHDLVNKGLERVRGFQREHVASLYFRQYLSVLKASTN